MRIFLLLIFGLYLYAAQTAMSAPASDVAQSPTCRNCGMDREKFSHSRMLIEYDGGSKVATCSLHCTAVELANTIDKIPVMVKVSDYEARELLNADNAVWVLGGGKKGVMTAQAKWAFASREMAERFIKSNGGSIVNFDDAIRAAYDDMYQDTKMIRELRELKRSKHAGDANHH